MLQIVENPNCYLETLKKAINEVNENYYIQRYDRADGNLRIQKPERVFVAEIYHQLRIVQDSSECIANHLIHIEITKMPFSSVLSNKDNCDVPTPARLSPDIVIHKSQSDSQPENQVLICEVKMKVKGWPSRGWPSIKQDFKKLLFYKISRLNFQNAVLIFCGNISDIEKQSSADDQTMNELLPCLKKHKITICAKDKNNRWELYQFN